jgi:hypothetical protein
MVLSGVCEERDLVEIIELSDHPWFVGVQFHPEFKSRPTKPHPLFQSFVEATVSHHKQIRSQGAKKSARAAVRAKLQSAPGAKVTARAKPKGSYERH